MIYFDKRLLKRNKYFHNLQIDLILIFKRQIFAFDFFFSISSAIKVMNYYCEFNNKLNS